MVIYKSDFVHWICTIDQLSSDVLKLTTPKMGRKRRSITELGGPNPMAKTSTPTGIYFETDL